MNINYRIKPFWFWNGDMDNQQIALQIKEMHEKGIGGFFVHPRQGLEVPYLSNEWFEKVSVAVEVAKRYHMEVWLYDEYPYPSGISAGEVIVHHPEYQAFILDYKTAELSSDEEIIFEIPMSEVLFAGAYQIKNNSIQWDKFIDLRDHIGITYREHIYQESGLTYYNKKRYFTGNLAKMFKWKALPGKWKLFLFFQYPLKSFKYFGTFIDPLNKDAIKLFIQTTHERYKKYLGYEFGKTIKGFFTDETAPFGGKLPWSKTIPYIFEKTYGYNLIENLPKLISNNIFDEDIANIKYQFWKLIVDTFIESYDKQIFEWCHQNNLLYVGEKPILRSSQLQFMDIPGIDAGHQKAGDTPLLVSENYRANPKIASSAAHFYQKERVLCECFHSIGWSMTIQDMKWIYDWLIMQGINMFVPHAFYYSTDGLKKHDAPPSAFLQMPWWQNQTVLSDYLSNLTQMLSKCKRKVDILLLDPISSQWTCFSEKNIKEKLSKDFCKIQESLIKNNIDYYIVDQSLISSFSVQNNKICYKDEKYELLIIPPISNIEKETWKKIKEFILNDCKVIFVGCMPFQNINDIDVVSEINSLFNIDVLTTAKEYFNNSGNLSIIKLNDNCLFVRNHEKLLNVIADIYKNQIEIIYSEDDDLGILSSLYEGNTRKLLFLVNPTPRQKNCIIKIKKDFIRFDNYTIRSLLDTKEVFQVSTDFYEDKISFSIKFSPFQSYLLEITNTNHEQNIEKYSLEQKIDLGSEWKINLGRLNPLRIDNWKLKIEFIDNPKLAFESEKVICAKPIIDHIEEIKIPILIKTKSVFGCPKEIALSPMHLIYKSSFTSEINDRELWLVIENGSIKGNWYIMVNDNKILPHEFIIKEFYSPSNLAYELSRYLKLGENKIEVHIYTEKTSDGLLIPIYIFGRIGVYKAKNGWVISNPPSRGQFNKNIENGLPFFAGTIIYEKEIELPNFADNIDYIRFYIAENIHDSINLYVNNQFIGSRCWQPYFWNVPIELIKDNNKITLKLELKTSLLALFEGEVINSETHTITPI